MHARNVREMLRERKRGFLPSALWTMTMGHVGLPSGCKGLKEAADECDAIRARRPDKFWNVVGREGAADDKAYVEATLYAIRNYGDRRMLAEMIGLLGRLEERNADGVPEADIAPA